MKFKDHAVEKFCEELNNYGDGGDVSSIENILPFLKYYYKTNNYKVSPKPMTDESDDDKRYSNKKFLEYVKIAFVDTEILIWLKSCYYTIIETTYQILGYHSEEKLSYRKFKEIFLSMAQTNDEWWDFKRIFEQYESFERLG